MAKRITFSLRDTDRDIEEYLKSHANYSEYLRRLIRNDMTGAAVNSIEKRILKILENYVKINASTDAIDANKSFVDDILRLEE